MKLYADPMACSLASHVALVAAGLPHEIVWIDLKTWGDPATKRTEDGRDFLAINPKGQVPVLELDDGSRLTEGSAILQYIGDHAPQSQLVPPAGTAQRYQQQEWLNFIATELHKAVFSPYFGADKQQRLPPEALKQHVLDILARRFDYLETCLHGRRYLMGDRFTVADAYLLVILNWALHARVDLARWPAIAAYCKAVNEHPAVRQVQRQERELRTRLLAA